MDNLRASNVKRHSPNCRERGGTTDDRDHAADARKTRGTLNHGEDTAMPSLTRRTSEHRSVSRPKPRPKRSAARSRRTTTTTTMSGENVIEARRMQRCCSCCHPAQAAHEQTTVEPSGDPGGRLRWIMVTWFCSCVVAMMLLWQGVDTGGGWTEPLPGRHHESTTPDETS